jgi:hypothetical protein
MIAGRVVAIPSGLMSMSISGADFRKTRIDVLRFLASGEEQRDFARRVHYEDYGSEFLGWWFEDFVPDSELFRSAFAPAEIEILRRLSSELKAHDVALEDSVRTITQLQGDSNWLKVMAAARAALESLDASAD